MLFFDLVAVAGVVVSRCVVVFVVVVAVVAIAVVMMVTMVSLSVVVVVVMPVGMMMMMVMMMAMIICWLLVVPINEALSDDLTKHLSFLFTLEGSQRLIENGGPFGAFPHDAGHQQLQEMRLHGDVDGQL